MLQLRRANGLLIRPGQRLTETAEICGSGRGQPRTLRAEHLDDLRRFRVRAPRQFSAQGACAARVAKAGSSPTSVTFPKPPADCWPIDHYLRDGLRQLLRLAEDLREIARLPRSSQTIPRELDGGPIDVRGFGKVE